MEEGDYEIEPDADDYRHLLEAVAVRLEQLAGQPVGRSWEVNHVVAEIGRLAEEIRSVLNEGN